jgi:hypothetical protein
MSYDLSQSPNGGVRFIETGSGGVASVVCSLNWNVTRAPTNTVLVGTLPANARICAIFITVPVVSNAVTTATVSVGLNGGSNTFFSAAQDVKSAIGNFSQAATANWAVSTAKQDVSCTYTETGGASSSGTFTVTVLYSVL